MVKWSSSVAASQRLAASAGCRPSPQNPISWAGRASRSRAWGRAIIDRWRGGVKSRFREDRGPANGRHERPRVARTAGEEREGASGGTDTGRGGRCVRPQAPPTDWARSLRRSAPTPTSRPGRARAGAAPARRRADELGQASGRGPSRSIQRAGGSLLHGDVELERSCSEFGASGRSNDLPARRTAGGISGGTPGPSAAGPAQEVRIRWIQRIQSSRARSPSCARRRCAPVRARPCSRPV